MPGERLTDTEPSPPTARHGGRADTLRVMVVDDHQMVVQLMARGLDNRAIAGLLHLALTRVRWYVQVLLEKLEVHSKLRAVARAAELGLIER
jgi:DNA-binding NarL/FixJ family response regulator